jgi:hypothetical protein
MTEKQTKAQFCKVLNRHEELKQKRKAAQEAKQEEAPVEGFTSRFIKPWINNTRW